MAHSFLNQTFQKSQPLYFAHPFDISGLSRLPFLRVECSRFFYCHCIRSHTFLISCFLSTLKLNLQLNVWHSKKLPDLGSISKKYIKYKLVFQTHILESILYLYIKYKFQAVYCLKYCFKSI